MTQPKYTTRSQWLMECAKDFENRATSAEGMMKQYLRDAAASAISIAFACRDGPMFSEHDAVICQKLIEQNASLKPTFRVVGFNVGMIARINSL